MGILGTIAALIVTLGILVTIHEYGHFWVARRCGVHVVRFSIGFGKPLFGWNDRRGTRYVIAAIPLGGYVQMLDEREGNVPAERLHEAFNRKSLGQRTAIVLAGPVANFLFAIFAYWVMFVTGITSVAPVIGELAATSPAAAAGMRTEQEIVSVDGEETRTWDAVNLRLVRRLGETGTVRIGVAEPGSDHRKTVEIPIDRWLVGSDRPDPIGALGIRPWRPPVPPRIGRIEDGGRAADSGLRPGDLVVQANGREITDWLDWVHFVRERPEQDINVTVERDGRRETLRLRPAERTLEDGRRIGYIGAGVEPPEWPPEMIREVRFGPLDSVLAASRRTWDMSVLTLDALWKMLEGLVSVKNLSGPITIAKVAGASASSGLESFLGFLAYLSVSLGVLNLLPIPVLDGGHLMYYFIELLRGRPVSQEAQWFGFRIGIIIIVGIMALAFYNDLSRL